MEFAATPVVRREIEVLDLNSVVRPSQGLEPRQYITFQIVPLDYGIPEDYWLIFNQMENETSRIQATTIEYPIVDPQANAPMKTISLQNLPNFHGMASEDLDAFFFEFDVLWRGYDYTTEPKKLKLFPSTLKGEALQWFMELGGGTITSWDQMKEAFLTIYQDYFWSRDLREEIFEMMFEEDEILEKYVERFQYNLQRSPYTTLPKDVLKTALIMAMKYEWIETLNLMGQGDISKEEYDDIIKLCIRCSQGSTRTKPGTRDALSRSSRTAGKELQEQKLVIF